jgi:hypothetical protein
MRGKKDYQLFLTSDIADSKAIMQKYSENFFIA